ncbi:MAG: alpha-D-ribose 1-methylphosphonate 5-triphosphate diphosphatase [Acetobacteraceae bacterium]
MSGETILTNALVVTPEEAFDGTVVVRRRLIAEVSRGRSNVPVALDLEGDLLLPGLVDVHTDNLERHMMPRPGVRWSARAALLAHDAQVSAAGVTTVLDALCVGEVEHADQRDQMFRDGVDELRALAPRGLLRAEHFLHLRCEISVEAMRASFEPVAHDPLVRMVSLMDHTPGVGQFADIERYVKKNARQFGMTEPEARAYVARRWETRERVRDANRAAILAHLKGRDVALASHDDRTEEEVAHWHAAGVTISEFPVSLEAAEAAKARGMGVIAGGPNIVRGGSHSGNVAAADLVRRDLVDVFASDYVPASLLATALLLHDRHGLTLPAAVATVSLDPARLVGLQDRGAIAPGLRADLVQVHLADGHPLVRQVWREGRRVA